jgi:hypothetical protein
MGNRLPYGLGRSSHWPEMVRGCLPSGQLFASFGKAPRCVGGCEEDERAVSGTIWADLALTTRKERVPLREEKENGAET